MPVDERTFAAEAAGWVTEFLNGRPDLPFGRANVEAHVQGTAQRHDFRLYRRDPEKPVLTGEIKMPDAAQGNHPLNATLVDDALTKASRDGIRYCFTWNVRQFVMFDSHIQGVPYAQRHIEGPADVVEASVSDDVRQGWVWDAIKQFWEDYLGRFAALVDGRRPFQPFPIDQRFIGWLEGALEDPISNTEDMLVRLTSTDAAFNSQLNMWMLSQGWEPSSQPHEKKLNLERTSRLSCYILLTKLVFYEVLRQRFRQMSPLALDGIDTSEQLRETLGARFGEAIRYSRDYETIFGPSEDDLGFTIPFLSSKAPSDWARLVRRIHEFDFSSLEFDVIGRMYERLIGASERRRFGQFYTSPDVVDLINAFCIRTPDDHVLDPACGGGTFLVRAYARKRELTRSAGRPSVTHEDLLSQIFGVDIGAFPAHLSTINLAVRHLSDEANYPRVARASFFDAQAGIPLYDIPLTGDSTRSIALNNVDAVVGNPPYIRQEGINSDDKSSYVELFKSEWPGQTSLSRRSDIYIYFFTHAASLLKSGGYLGFITSIGWLDTEYGFKLQEFFLRNFRIIAVIESQVDKWFEDARVTTAVTILRREHNSEKRENNLVRFIQLQKPLDEVYSAVLGRPLGNEATRQADMDEVRGLIEGIHEPQNTEYWRVRVRAQSILWQDGIEPPTDGAEGSDGPGRYRAGKWGQYIRGPSSWFELMERAGSSMTPLQELATVRFGFKTGADRFFCVRDVTQQHLDEVRDPRGFRDRWGISRKDTRRIRIVLDGSDVEHLVERRFVEPELHSLMEVQRAVVGAKDVGRMVINASVPRASFRRTHFADYVAYAEREGWHTGSTVASRARSRPWYDLALRPKSERAHMFWPMAQQYRHVIPLNKDLLPANHNLFDLWAIDSEQVKALWAVLNSTITALAKHQFGRAAGVEGSLKTEVVDVRMMLVPDIRRAPPGAINRAIDACERISRRDALRFLHEEFSLEDRRELDDATLEILGIEDLDMRESIRDRLYRDVTKLQKAVREREIIAQRDRRRSQRASSSPQAIADELWAEHLSSLNLLQFPDEFVTKPGEGTPFDLPAGEVEVGEALFGSERLLKAGTVRVGGRDGQVIDVGTVSQALFLQALSRCHRTGQVCLPSPPVCDEALGSFTTYYEELRNRCTRLASQRSPDQRRQRAIANALLRKALQWTRP